MIRIILFCFLSHAAVGPLFIDKIQNILTHTHSISIHQLLCTSNNLYSFVDTYPYTYMLCLYICFGAVDNVFVDQMFLTHDVAYITNTYTCITFTLINVVCHHRYEESEEGKYTHKKSTREKNRRFSFQK